MGKRLTHSWTYLFWVESKKCEFVPMDFEIETKMVDQFFNFYIAIVGFKPKTRRNSFGPSSSNHQKRKIQNFPTLSTISFLVTTQR
jgi:hypothetical protein